MPDMDMRTPPTKSEAKREKSDYKTRSATAPRMKEKMTDITPRLKEKMTDVTPRLKDKMTKTGRKGLSKPPKGRSSKKR